MRDQWDWYIYLHLIDYYGELVAHYAVRPMNPIGT